MARNYFTEGISFPGLHPTDFINQMIAHDFAKDREEAIAYAILNGKPVLNRRSWDRACYQSGNVSEGTLIKLAIIFNAFNEQVAA